MLTLIDGRRHDGEASFDRRHHARGAHGGASGESFPRLLRPPGTVSHWTFSCLAMALVSGRRHMRGMPKRRPDPAGEVTAHENFLYLLAEMEASIERGTIRWTAELAETAQRRLANIYADVAAIAVRLRIN